MQKLAQELGMLSKVRYNFEKTELKNIYHTLFRSHLQYGCQIWIQCNSQFIKDKIEKLQKRAFRIISIADFWAPSLLLKEWKILKMRDIVEIQNTLLVHSYLRGKLPKSFEKELQ